MRNSHIALVIIALLAAHPLCGQQAIYDAIGRLVWSTQAGGMSTTYAYDPNGNLTATGSVSAGADADGDGIPDYYEISFSGTTTGLVSDQDEDRDGLNNLHEFAFGRNARMSDAANLTPISLEPPSGSNQYFTLKYNRPKSASLLHTYAAEVSFDLNTWSKNAADVEQTGIVDLGGGLEQVTVRALSSISTQRRIFLRIRITQL